MYLSGAGCRAWLSGPVVGVALKLTGSKNWADNQPRLSTRQNGIYHVLLGKSYVLLSKG